MDFDQNLGELQRKVAQSQEGVGRRKLIYESLGVESGQSILDLGCGGGYQARILALAVGSEGRVVGVDRDAAQARALCAPGHGHRLALRAVDPRVARPGPRAGAGDAVPAVRVRQVQPPRGNQRG